MRRSTLFICVALGGIAFADTPAPPANTPAFQDIIACRAVADDKARLACFDRASATLDTAAKKGDVLVIDRAQAQQTNREAFGFHLPSLDILLPGLNDDEIESQSGVIESAYQQSNGRWVITLQGGAVWSQMDGDMKHDPEPGQTLTMTKGSLGGFFIKVGNQPAVKGRRTG